MSIVVQTPLTVVDAVTDDATLAAGKHTPVNASGGAVTVTLPTPAHIGARLAIEKIDTSGNTVTVSGTIRGAADSVELTHQYQSIEFFAEGLSSWRPVSERRTDAGLRAAYGLVFKADGGTYGTDTADATAHIQGLIDAAAVAGGGTVFIPAGTYKLTGTLTLPNNGVDDTAHPQVNLIGAGREATVLHWPTDLGPGAFGITFADRNSGAAAMSLGLIADLYLQGPAASGTVGVAPAQMNGIGNTARREIRGVRIRGFYAGLCMTGDHTQFEHVNVGGCFYGLYADVANPALWGGWKFIDCQFNGNYAAGVAVSPDSSIDGCLFQGCWIGFQPFGFLKESGAGSNDNFLIRTIFDKIGFELLGNGIARVDGTNGQILEVDFRRCYHSNDGSFNWAVKPDDAPFDVKIFSQVKILSPEIGVGGWGPGDVAVFKATFLSQVIFEDPNGTVCNAVNSAGKVFATGAGDEFVKIVAPGVWEGHLRSVRDGIVTVRDAVSLLDGQARQATASGVPLGVAMTGGAAGTRIVVATDGQVPVNKDASITGRNQWMRAGGTAGKLAAASAADVAIFGISHDPVDNTANTARIVLRPASTPPAVFADVNIGLGGDGNTLSQAIPGTTFTMVNLNGETTDTADAFDLATHLYTVPADGIYECAAKVRLQDGTAGGGNIGVGVHTSNSDGPWFKWMIPGTGSGGNQRQVLDYFRAASFTKGDQLRLYTWSSSAFNIAMAQLTIRKVG